MWKYTSSLTAGRATGWFTNESPEDSSWNHVTFFHVRSDKSKRRTKTVKKTCEPKWNQTFVYTHVHRRDFRNHMLELTLWDQPRSPEEDSIFMGEVAHFYQFGVLLKGIPQFSEPTLEQTNPHVLSYVRLPGFLLIWQTEQTCYWMDRESLQSVTVMFSFATITYTDRRRRGKPESGHINQS